MSLPADWMSKGWLEPLTPLAAGVSKAPGLAFQFGIAVAAFAIIIFVIVILKNTTQTPTAPTGAIGLDYDARAGQRQSLNAYMTANNIPDGTPMTQFQIATANFGGIFTEDIGTFHPWIGTVSPDAVSLQVAAGARAVIFDIWPDPADPTTPVVCAMMDIDEWPGPRVWRDTGGLNAGVGRYSNWQMLTRNKVDAGTMLTAACNAAFNSVTGQQNNDPFFITLRLHGAMTIDYLNRLGGMVQKAMAGHAMAATYGSWGQQKMLCSAPVSEFISKDKTTGGYAFIIVCPDVSPGYYLLPGINTYPAFVQQLQGTVLGEVANMVESNLNTVWFDPASSSAIAQASQPNCVINVKDPSALIPPAQAGFCVVQPSIGGRSTRNSDLFSDASFQSCQQTGAQMVAVNLFSPDGNDATLQSWFSPNNFGTYSFKKGT